MALDLLTDHSHYVVAEVQFLIYSSEEIRKLSVKEILNPTTFNDAQQPNNGGLYDPALGSLESNEQCATCSLGRLYCPGHMGHIELPVPVYHPLFFDTVYMLLKSSCLRCCKISVQPKLEHLFVNKSKLLRKGRFSAFRYIEELQSSNKDKLEQELKLILDKFTEEALTADSSKDSDFLTRNRKELRNSLVKKFVYNFAKGLRKCPHCSRTKKAMRQDKKAKIVIVASTRVLKKDQKKNTKNISEIECTQSFDEESESEENGSHQPRVRIRAEVVLLTAGRVKEICRKLWENHKEMFVELFPFLAESMQKYPTDNFFLDAVGVPANRHRPISELKDVKYEHTQTVNLHQVLCSCLELRQILGEMDKEPVENNNTTQNSGPTRKSQMILLSEAITRLQKDVNTVFDKRADPSNDSPPGIRQLLESKEGLFRKNIMGKRVNHACRSVISPDPNISTNEIGLPEVFAKSLTYPEPVTPWNVHELRQAVINGPDIHPGAVLVTNEDGTEIRLDPKNKTRREAIAKQLLTPSPTSSRASVFGARKVHRHLKNGDMMLLNRQPTLHRPSIQGHIARVLRHEKTMRLNYMNCKAYNADFDGDEMSAHFPQSELCRAEAYHIASTDFQYLGPKDGTPLAGLMQDHIVSGVHCTIRGKFFCKEDYCSLVYSAVFDKCGPIHILPPSIIKPYRSYTGKQIVSTVILNVIPEDADKLSFTGKAKVPEKSWIKSDTGKASVPFMGESDVVIRQGELLVGILDKEHLGATSYGLVHCVNELYGGRVAGRLLTCLGRLFLSFLKLRGFTLGIEDILVKEKADHKRRKIIKKSLKVGTAAAMKALDLKGDITQKELEKSMQKAHFDQDERQLRELDLSMRGQTNDIQNSVVNTIMPHGLIKMFPANNLQLMVKSGSKGSMVNTMQISCLLGQIELEGKRPPLMLSGKTLPSFYAYDASPRAGGFVSDRFLTGVRQQEYFFHCMAGREGLVDTAVKTSRSGYLQRCIVKHLEGIKVNYDSTVRDSDNSIIQFHYGEDGLDVSKAGFLNAKQLPLIVENFGAIKKNCVENGELSKRVRKAQRKIDKWKESKSYKTKTRDSPFLQYCKTVDVSLKGTGNKYSRKKRDIALCESWEEMSSKKKQKFEAVHYDPLLCKYWPYERGVFPEKLWELLKTYAADNCNKNGSLLTEEELISVMDAKVKHSLAQPGEAVGLLCAQSIGEPSTQMTLNTFHFAGRGEMNMTLGIPRLREILMTGTKMIKTPAVDVPVLEGTEARSTVKLLQKWLNKVILSEVLEDVEVATWLSLKGQRSRLFQVTFKFLPRSCYKQQYCITPDGILQCMEEQFFKNLVDTIQKNMSKVKGTGKSSSRSEKGAEKEKNNDPASDAEVDLETDAGQVPANISMTAADDDGDDLSDVDMEPDNKDDYSHKQGKKHLDEQEYEDEENLDEDGVAIEEQDTEPGLIEDMLEEDEMKGDKESEEEEITEMEDSFFKMKRQKETIEKNTEMRRNNVLQVAQEIVDYKFDEKKHLWCEVTLSFPLQDNHLDLSDIIKNLAKKTVIHHIKGISKSFLGEEQGDHGPELHLKTEGINMEEMFKHPEVLALNRLYCNNIFTVEQTYGIEAARNVIIKELQSVFGAYGIQVDYRHLSLLADYSTFEGTHKPFTRMNMASTPSPFQRITFETSMAFLLDACINAEVDDLSSPSSQITLGKNITCGTGSVDMLVPLTL